MSKAMFYTACKTQDLGSDSAKILHPTEEAARSEGMGSGLALDVRYGERPDRFYSNRTDANGYPQWSVEPRRISGERWLISGPVPKWLVVPSDQGEPRQLAVARPSKINRRILEAVSDIQGDDESTLINDTRIAERTGIELKMLRDQMVLLADKGMIVDADDSASHADGLTAWGRISLRKPNKRTSRVEARMTPDEIQRHILQAIQDTMPTPNASVQDSVLAERTGLTVQDVRDHLDLLEEEDKVKLLKVLSGTVSVLLRPRGRLALKEAPKMKGSGGLTPPVEVQESLARFQADHPDEAKVAFIMMRFGQTGLHEKVVKGIKTALEPHGITGLRADDKQYHDDLFSNILTYIHGCGMGIAVFERIESDDFNPNVSLEVGYMMAMKRPVCLLKDKTLRALPSDLVGRLYKPFDPQDPNKSIPPVLRQWLGDKGLA